MTKAERIRQLYDGKRTTREIAERVGCNPAYVRVVARQRIYGSRSITDVVYEKRVRSHGDRKLASRLAKAAKAAERKRGSATEDCRRAYNRVYYRALMRSGRAALRKEAAHA